MKKIIFTAAFLILGSLNLYAQESCGCSSAAGGCSASQSCGAGYMAVCSCTSSGCVSYCQLRAEPVLQSSVIVSKLQKARTTDFGNVLSSLFRKTIVFKPNSKDFRFAFPESELNNTSHWDVLEYLSRNAELTVNGQSIEFWKNIREGFLSGGEIKLCAGSATPQEFLNEISFITGKNFSIVSGNGKAKVIGSLSASSLEELLQNLSNVGKITIKEQ